MGYGVHRSPEPDKTSDVVGVVHEPLASMFVGAVAVPDDTQTPVIFPNFLSRPLWTYGQVSDVISADRDYSVCRAVADYAGSQRVLLPPVKTENGRQGLKGELFV